MIDQAKRNKCNECDRESAKDAKDDPKKENGSESVRVCLRALCAFAVAFLFTGCEKTVRFATYNASLSRDRADQLLFDLTNPNDPQAKAVADVIQHQNPDVLLLTDVDWDYAERARNLFEQNYLSIPQGGAPGMHFAYHFTGPVNCGVASGFDLDHDGKVVTTPGTPAYAGDAIGWGLFPGQHGMMLLSKYPIDTMNIRTFTRFKWKNMPAADLPTDANGQPWYSDEALNVLRLATTDFWDVPITVGDKKLHLLINRPTAIEPDDASHRNAKRNHDEIRFWCDYLSGNATKNNPAQYISDDTNAHGGVEVQHVTRFVIMGEQESESLDSLLKQPSVDAVASKGNPEILLSKRIKVAGSNVLTPAPATQPVPGSTGKQRFVYFDVKF